MATLTLEDYKYSQKLRLYNSEGRENVGINYVTDASWYQFYDTEGSTLQTFYVDLTQAPPAEGVTVCSFKNGPSIHMTWHDYTPGDPPHGNYGAWIDLMFYDEHGDPQLSSHQEWYITWRPEGQTPENTPIYYYPPSFEYGLPVHEYPIGAWTGGGIVAYDKTPIIIVNKPDFRNNVIEKGRFEDWYTFYGYNVMPFDDFMIELGEGSTPKSRMMIQVNRMKVTPITIPILIRFRFLICRMKVTR